MANKKPKKKQRKDSQLIIRISSEDRDAFVALCDELDTSAAREVRRFIRDFLRDHAKPQLAHSGILPNQKRRHADVKENENQETEKRSPRA